MTNAPFIVKFPVAVILTVILALVIYIGAVVQVYVLAWILGLIGQIF